MPNWCECDLFIRAKDECKNKELELKKFIMFAIRDDEEHRDVLSTENFIPYPSTFKEMDKKDPNKSFNLNKHGKDEKHLLVDGMNGYDWCCVNWGTKWGICRATITEQNLRENRLVYSFECAWSPALPVVEKMSELFPNLLFTIQYYECGAGYQGEAEYDNGECVFHEDKEYFDGTRGG